MFSCKYCDMCFNSRNLLKEHLHLIHKNKTRDTSKICHFCGLKYVGRKRAHEKVCTCKLHGPHIWTTEEKKQLSQKRKAYLLANPDKHPWKYNSKFKSIPCEHIKDILREKYSFIEEYTDTSWKKNYSLDIALIDKKIAIEDKFIQSSTF